MPALQLVLCVTPAVALFGLALIETSTLENDRAQAEARLLQSLYSAEGGLTRARWALLAEQTLQSAGTALPAGIASASATQNGVASGALVWGDTVLVQATGVSGSWSRTVAQCIVPVPPPGVDLRNVITSPGQIDADHDHPTPSTFEGPVRSGDALTTLENVLGTHPLTIASVDLLDVDAAIATILAHTTALPVTSAEINATSVVSPYLMDGSGGLVVYRTSAPGLSVPNGSTTKAVAVRGECLWIIEDGWDVGKTFEIQGQGLDPRLYVLAGADASTGKGFDFRKEMTATGGVSVLLVTDGTLDFAMSCTLPSVAMYGASVHCASGQTFTYDPAIFEPWLASLAERDLLPVVAGATHSLSIVTGSWNELSDAP